MVHLLAFAAVSSSLNEGAVADGGGAVAGDADVDAEVVGVEHMAAVAPVAVIVGKVAVVVQALVGSRAAEVEAVLHDPTAAVAVLRTRVVALASPAAGKVALLHNVAVAHPLENLPVAAAAAGAAVVAVAAPVAILNAYPHHVAHAVVRAAAPVDGGVEQLPPPASAPVLAPPPERTSKPPAVVGVVGAPAALLAASTPRPAP